MIWSKVLLNGMIVSFLLGGWVLLILKINPRYELKSYPQEIVETVEPQTKTEKKAFLILAIPMLVIIISYLISSVLNTYNSSSTFLTIFLHYYVVLMIWNVVDLLIVDWLIFCTINPDFIVISTTKGNKAYKNYKYHFVGFIKGIFFSIVFAWLLSLIVFIIQIVLR